MTDKQTAKYGANPNNREPVDEVHVKNFHSFKKKLEEKPQWLEQRFESITTSSAHISHDCAHQCFNEG
ncbi:unnamed protein product [Allacma fusca]|uniref:Uncharacterized protein n=1 Tax=Allacma fusca TaxID=39272 RepID=A0A8J2M6D5_9HEXA|nr:unnamed protein product [Allacma fusca]